MQITPYKYELALSYAHKDEDVAEIISEEFQNIFQNKFFKDTLRSHELASASDFKERLHSIFSESHYAVILYSENYQDGQFTQVELKSITEQYPKEDDHCFFIINLNETTVIERSIENLTYIPLCLRGKSQAEQTHLIKDVVHNKIKQNIIQNALTNAKDSRSISVNTIFTKGVPPWDPQYTWNIYATEFVEPGSRNLKPGCNWKNLWEYIRSEFLKIYDPTASAYKIQLNCHLSIAYKLGGLYKPLIVPKYRNLVLDSMNGPSFAFSKEVNGAAFGKPFLLPKKNLKEIPGDDHADSIICMISITNRDAFGLRQTIQQAASDNQIWYKKIFIYSKTINIATADELEQTAENLNRWLAMVKAQEEVTKIHLFLRTPAALAFVLGNNQTFPGNILLYEYDQATDSYTKALERSDP